MCSVENANTDKERVKTMETMAEAAQKLGMTKQQLHPLVKKGIVSYRKSGNIVLINPETARRELLAAGFYERKEKLRLAKERKHGYGACQT